MSAPHLRVLVVAAHAEDADFAIRVLEDHGDRAERCSDVPEALARLSRDHFDLAFVSLSMPRGDGLALVHHLRALYPSMDVVVMAGADEVEEAASAMALGVSSTVVTPLTGDDVLLAADRTRERRVLLAERAGLHAKIAETSRRTETYARCAAFVAEPEPERVAERVLEACEAEVPSTARALYIAQSSSPGHYVCMAHAGEEGGMPEELTDRDLPDGPAEETVGELGERVYLQLSDGEQRFGAVVLVRDRDTPLSVEQQEALEVIARLSSAALTASRRVDAIARGGIKDPETGAYTFAYFGDVAAREIDRALRHQGTFSLLTVRTDQESPDAEPSSGQRTELRKLVTEGVLRAVKESDVVARFDDSEYYVLLPETGQLGALACRRRIFEQLAQLKDEARATLAALATAAGVGVSAFPADGSDLGELLKLSRKRAERSRAGEWQRLGLSDRPFWSCVDGLLEADDAPEGSSVLAARAVMPVELVTRIATSLIKDAAREGVAGTLYLAGGQELAQAVTREVDAAGEMSLRTWLLGPSPSVRDPAARLRIPLTDARLNQTALILCVTERAAYCLAARRDGSGQLKAYHSSDLDLVEGLVSRLQAAYHLQPELR